MVKSGEVARPLEQRELLLTRVFDVPRSRVFQAWIDARQVAQWWGPHGFTNPVCELDARPGGALRIEMRAPDGVVHPMTGVYDEIEAPARLVFSSGALDPLGHPMFEVRTSVTFSEQGGKTALTLHARVTMATPAAARHLDGMEPGWTQTLERLGQYLTRG